MKSFQLNQNSFLVTERAILAECMTKLERFYYSDNVFCSTSVLMEACMVYHLVIEMDFISQILDRAVCVLLNANAHSKGTNNFLLLKI